MTKDDLLIVAGLKFRVKHDSSTDYYLWTDTFGSGKMLICWINEDNIPTSIDYTIDEVFEYFNNGTWFENESQD